MPENLPVKCSRACLKKSCSFPSPQTLSLRERENPRLVLLLGRIFPHPVPFSLSGGKERRTKSL